MLKFGVSFIGIAILVLVAIPNIIWAKNKPVDYKVSTIKENLVLSLMENIGRVGVFLSLLIFKIRIIQITPWIFWLALAGFFILLYYVDWLLYFKSDRKMCDMYDKVGLSLFPVLAFLFAGMYGMSIFLIGFSIVLGIGHLGIHRQYYKALGIEKMNIHILLRIARIILVLTVSLVSVIVVCVCSFFIARKNVNYLTHMIDNVHGIEEQQYVELGGMEQYLLIRGQNIKNPVIVWVHGGPASPDSCASSTYTDELIDDFTVIEWDQRGCGRTYKHNRDIDPNNDTLSFEQAQEDLDDLVDYARTRFGQDKVILVGHSYGTLLSTSYIQNHQDKVQMYIGIGQTNSIESDDYAYNYALEKAKEACDDTTEMEEAYAKYLNDKNIRNLIDVRSYEYDYQSRDIESNFLELALSSPYSGYDDIEYFSILLSDIDRYYYLNRSLLEYVMTMDVLSYGTDYQIPVCVISGENDWNTPVKYQQNFVDSISSPSKEIHIIERCGHMVMEDNPVEFAKVFKTFVNDNM